MNGLKYHSIVVCLLLIVLPGCLQSEEMRSVKGANQQEAITYQNAKQSFAVRWFQCTVEQNKDKNFVVSPFGLSMILDALILGSSEKTKDELEKACFTPDFETNWFESAIQTSLSLSKMDELKMTGSMWIQDEAKVDSDYIGSLLKLTNQDLQKVDFANEKTKEKINQWISEKTDGRIKDFLDSILQETQLLLINTLVFGGQWQNAFDSKNTKKGYFTGLNGKDVRISMMQQKNEFRYYEENNLQFLEMPYNEDRFSILVFLPKEEKDYPAFLHNFSVDQLNSFRKKSKKEEVDVRFPKFILEFNLDLIPSLKAMGVKEAFTDAANFEKIEKNKRIKVSQMTQGIYIKMDEKGTEAAAAVSAEFIPKSADLPKNFAFYADRPFLFCIVENKTNSILFMGQIVEPNEILKSQTEDSSNFNASIESSALVSKPASVPDKNAKVEKETESLLNTSGIGGTME